MDVLPGEYASRLPQGVTLINPGRGWPASITPAWLLSRTEIDPTAKLLYGRLCGYCGEKHYCWPSLNKLASDLGLSRSATEKAMRRLRESGLVLAYSRRAENSSSVYFFPAHPWMTEGPVPRWDQGPEDGGGSGGTSEGEPEPNRVSEVNPNVHAAHSTSVGNGAGEQGAEFPSSLAASNVGAPKGPHVVNDVSLTYAHKNGSQKRHKAKEKQTVTKNNPGPTSRRQRRGPHVVNDVSLTSSTTHGMISGKEIRERDQTSPPSTNPRTGTGTGAEEVLRIYDSAYAAIHGKHYGPCKRDYSAAAWAWQEATHVAQVELEEKNLAETMLGDLREQVLVHWCNGLARSEGYAAEKRWQFWLIEAARAELGTPFRIVRVRKAKAEVDLDLDDGPLTPPEELPRMWEKVMHAFRTGEVAAS